jgi:hypothetical protein
VGLQLLNTGHREIQTNIAQRGHFFCAESHNFLLDLSANHIFVEKFFHKFGNIVIIQKAIKITQENNFQTIGSTQIKTVEAFNKSEKSTIDIINEDIII